MTFAGTRSAPAEKVRVCPVPSLSWYEQRMRFLHDLAGANRLLHDPSSPYKGNNYGALGNWGNAGHFGEPGNIGSTWVDGFVDISQR